MGPTSGASSERKIRAKFNLRLSFSSSSRRVASAARVLF
jgi:hypothetical protein